MANLAHLELLKRGAEGWRNWWKNCQLFGPDLDEADFKGESLREFEFQRASLLKADFAGVDLTGGRFIHATLTGASLAGANLKDVEFRSSSLRDVDLRGAVLEFTRFLGVDLSEVQGLSEVRFRGPCTIDIETFFRSRGCIPDQFLRGVGVPDELIDLQRSLVTSSVWEFYSCFISYSHSDRSFARRLHDALQGRGIRCWLDEKDLLPGDEIMVEIDTAIRVWDKVLLCCSEESLSSWWVERELEKAIQKEEQIFKETGERRLSLIPLNLDGFLFQDSKHPFGSILKSRLASNFVGWQSDNAIFEGEFDRLVTALNVNRERSVVQSRARSRRRWPYWSG